MITALRPSELDAAKRDLARLTAPKVTTPSPDTVKAALERLAPAPAFPVTKASTPAAKWAAKAAITPEPLPMPPPRRTVTSFPPGERFVAVMEKEIADERQAAREAARLEPLTFTISDQQELRRIYELAQRMNDRPVPMIRRHLRGWSREKLDAKREEQAGEPLPAA